MKKYKESFKKEKKNRKKGQSDQSIINIYNITSVSHYPELEPYYSFIFLSEIEETAKVGNKKVKNEHFAENNNNSNRNSNERGEDSSFIYEDYGQAKIL